MTMKSILFVAATTGAISLAVPVASAQAGFCDSGKDCRTVKIVNSASTVVTSVKITQQSTDGACETDERQYTQNLSATGGGPDGFSSQSFSIGMMTTCTYKVKFKTTKGCKGDKVAHIGPKQFRNGKNGVKLYRTCGTLKAGSFEK